MRNKSLSILLTLALLLSMFPTAALAAEPEVGGMEETQSGTELSNADVSTLADGSSAGTASDSTWEWVDRVNWTGHEYAKEFYDDLAAASALSADSSWLVNPVAGGNIVSKPIDSYTSSESENGVTVEYTYTVDSGLYYKLDNTTNDDLDTISKYMGAAYAAFDLDHPEVFWLTGNSRFMKSGDGQVYFVLTESGTKTQTAAGTGTGSESYSYDFRNTTDYTDIPAAIDQLNSNIAEIKKGIISLTLADYKVEYFDRWLTHNNEYNTAVATGDSASAPQSAWECVSALAGSSGANGPVCEGYARAMKVLCDEAGIPCVLVNGTALSDPNGTGSGGPHMWNYVKVGSAWYAVDTTWNDPTVSTGSAENQNYLMVGAQTADASGQTFSQSHQVTDQISNVGVNFTDGPTLSDTALVKQLEITKEPSKTVYTATHAFDPTGMELTATYWYTIGGTNAADKITGDYAAAGVTWDPTNLNVDGVTTVTITYRGKTATQDVTANPGYSIGTSSTLYGGTIEVSPYYYAAAGDQMTLTVTPDENFDLVSVNVYQMDKAKTPVPITGSGNTYTFTMPDYDVMVTAQFQQQVSTAPEFVNTVDTLTSADDNAAEFTLKNSDSLADANFFAYDSPAGDIYSDVFISFSGNTLTLRYNFSSTIPTEDVTYYVSVVENGKLESARTAITVHPYTKHSDATLSDLTFDSGTLAPSFDPDTTEYTITLPYSAGAVTVTPTVNDPRANTAVLVECSNNDPFYVDSGSPYTVYLTAGETSTITVTVTAEDNTTQTYTITVKREEPIYRIGIDIGDNVFPSEPVGYSEPSSINVGISNKGDAATGELSVTLSGADPDSFTVDPETIDSIPVNGYPTLTVTPKVGLAAGTYTATVTVSGGHNISDSFDVSFTVYDSLAEAAVNDAKRILEGWNPVSWFFDQAEANTQDALKTALVGKINSIFDTEHIEGLTVTAEDITVTGFVPAVAGTQDDRDGTNGSFAFTVALHASDQSETATVSGGVIGATPYRSSVATLSGLTLSEGTLTPDFSSNVYSYNATVASTTSSITVHPVTTDINANVTVNDSAWDYTVDLAVGENKITVEVTAEDGTTTQTYTITVTRLRPTYDVTLDVPEFDTVTEGYTAPGSITVTVTNVGTEPTGDLTVTLLDSENQPFTASVSAISSIAAGGEATFTIQYPTGLTAGTYEASVSVHNVNIDVYGYFALTVDPKFTLPTVTFDANGGDVSPASATTGEDGTLSSLPTPTRSGYEFDGWYTMPAGGSRVNTSTVFEADSTIYAHWTYVGTSTGGPTGGSPSTGGTTTTERNPDGSTTTTVTSPGGTVTETTRYPNGSTEVVETKKDGTVTTTTTDTSGNKTKVVENTNGSTETTISNKDGSSSTTTVSDGGQVTSEVKLPAGVVNDAGSQAVTLPMPEVPVTFSRSGAPTVTVDLPGGSTAKVEIPVKNVTPGTVAILVKADGTETVIKTSVTTADGVTVTLSDGDTVKIVDNSKAFSDVGSSYWASGSIDFATSRELFDGTTETTFTPDGTMTRAMIWTVLARLDDVDTTGTGGAWYAPGLAWATNSGISDGSSPNDYVSRQQLVTLLYRYAQLKGYDTGARADLSSFPDNASIASYATDAMAWAVAEGIINGMGDGTLNPNGNASRAQVAAILQRFVENCSL